MVFQIYNQIFISLLNPLNIHRLTAVKTRKSMMIRIHFIILQFNNKILGIIINVKKSLSYTFVFSNLEKKESLLARYLLLATLKWNMERENRLLFVQFHFIL